MLIALAVASAGRASTLSPMLDAWARQTRPLDQVVLSVPDAADVPPATAGLATTVVFGERGLCVQRNAALEALAGGCDLVIFADDDFLPSRRFVAQAARLFEAHPGVAVATGRVLADGIKGPGVPLERAQALVEAYDRGADPSPPRLEPTLGAYGCNMVVRTRLTEPLRFDERLPLYGWQEDIDFSRRCAARGAVVRTDAFAGVHLGLKSGRTSGVRLGYSQVVNPVYLARKGTLPPRHALKLMAGNLAANLLRCLRPEPFVDRAGRLRGNVIGLLDLARARVEPERMRRLS